MNRLKVYIAYPITGLSYDDVELFKYISIIVYEAI